MINSFRQSFHGEVFGPDQPEYEYARCQFNRRSNPLPHLVVQPVSVNDVVAAIKFAQSQGWRVSVKSGGYSSNGTAVFTNTLLLDMSKMKGIFVDKKFNTVTVQSGARWIDVVRAVAPYYIVCPYDCSTGVGGTILSGGFGPLVNSHGLIMDTVISADIVTAKCDQKTVNTEENEELFWALHGAGQLQYGVVTAFTLEIFDDIRPLLYTTKKTWNVENAGAMLKYWTKLFEKHTTWDKDIVSIITLNNFNLSLETLYFGEPQNGTRANVMFDNSQIATASSNHGMVSFLEWCELHRSRDTAYKYIIKSGFVQNLDDDLIDTMVSNDVTDCPDSGEYEITIEFLFGATTDISPGYTPFPHRSSCVQIVCSSKFRNNEDEWDVWTDFFGDALAKKRIGISSGW